MQVSKRQHDIPMNVRRWANCSNCGKRFWFAEQSYYSPTTRTTCPYCRTRMVAITHYGTFRLVRLLPLALLVLAVIVLAIANANGIAIR